jgi:hypothetical protein
MIDEKYFEKIDCEEKAYFIGFIAADGYISKDGYKLTFGLQYGDVDILNKFCELTNCTNVVRYREVCDKRTKKTYKQANLQVCSKNFVKSLSKYGLTNNKTKDFIIQNIPEKYIKDCVRGLFDGDGGLNNNHISLITTKENIEFIKKWLYLNKILVTNYIREIKKENNVWCFYIYADKIKFLDLIYKDSKIYLDRKYNSYLNINRKKTHKCKEREIILYKEDKIYHKFKSVIDCANFLNCSDSKIFYSFYRNNKIKSQTKGKYLNYQEMSKYSINKITPLRLILMRKRINKFCRI